jgi:hypothetical protein
MMEITTYISIITLNVNDFNSPIKRHILADFIKNKTQSFFSYKKCTSLADKQRLKVKRWEKISQANGLQK